MKGLTLWEPWASFIALGFKTVETRSWDTSYRGLLAIHAAKYKIAFADMVISDIFRKGKVSNPFVGINVLSSKAWPLGKIVAVGELVECRPVEEIRNGLPRIELEMGEYRDGMFGWILKNVRRVMPPLEFKGRQGLWEVPQGIEAKLYPRLRDILRTPVAFQSMTSG